MAAPRLVEDIEPGVIPGSNGSLVPLSSSPTALAALGSKLLFSADTENNGRELWVSDGTAAGTSLLVDIALPSLGNPEGDSNPSFIQALVNPFIDLAFFIANKQVWRSDGTAAGTFAVSNIVYPLYEFGLEPRDLTTTKDYAYYFAAGKLWVSAGLQEGADELGTILGSTIVSLKGSEGSLTPSNTIYFLGRNDPSSPFNQIWKSDPAPGTLMPVNGTLGAQKLATTRSDLYFTAPIPDNLLSEQEQVIVTEQGSPWGLWRLANGAPTLVKKPALVASGNPAPFSPVQFERFSYNNNFGSIGNTLFFTVERTETSATYLELWKSNGTTESTTAILSGTEIAFTSDLSLSSNTHLYFTAYTPEEGNELWITDGTTTQRVNPIAGPTGFMDNTNLDGAFSGDEFYFRGSNLGLWRHNSKTNETTQISGVEIPGAITNVNNSLFFSAFDNTHGSELWAYTPGSGSVEPPPPDGSGGGSTNPPSDSGSTNPPPNNGPGDLPVFNTPAFKPPGDLATVSISAKKAVIVEGESMAFEFKRDGSSKESLEVAIQISGTSTEGLDFSPIEKVVTFKAGKSSAKIKVDQTFDDLLKEGKEDVVISIAESTQYTLGSAKTRKARVQILDGTTLKANSPVGLEDGTLQFMIERNNKNNPKALENELVVYARLNGLTATKGVDFEDFRFGEFPLVFGGGKTKKPLYVKLFADEVADPPSLPYFEQFALNIFTSSTSNESRLTALGTIIDIPPAQASQAAFDLVTNPPKSERKTEKLVASTVPLLIPGYQPTQKEIATTSQLLQGVSRVKPVGNTSLIIGAIKESAGLVGNDSASFGPKGITGLVGNDSAS